MDEDNLVTIDTWEAEKDDRDEKPKVAVTKPEESEGSGQETNADQACQQEELDTLLSKIFSNDLIFDSLCSYLNGSDLKSISQTCKFLLLKVRESKKFKDNQILTVSKESSMSKMLTNKYLARVWRNVEIDMSYCAGKKTLRNAIKILGPATTTLGLYDAFFITLDNRGEQIINRNLTTFLANTPNLTSLSVDYTVVDRRLEFLNDSITKTENYKAAIQVLSNLEKLEILSGRSINSSTTWMDCESKDGIPVPFIQNLESISKIPMKNLKIFTLGKFFTTPELAKDMMGPILTLIREHRSNLIELNLLSPLIWSLDEIKSLHFSALSALSLVATKENADKVSTFLENHPNQLDSLSIQFKEGFPINVLQNLVEKNLISRLKRLQLKTSSFHGTCTNVEWGFLLSLTSLKEFELFQPRSFLGENEIQSTCNQLFNSLPEGLRRVRLRGLDVGWQGHELARIIATLSRFTSLTELSLMRCDNSINDDILHWICSNMSQLRILQLSHCTNLTDFGLSGINHDGTNINISIKDLKALRKLTLRECKELSSQCLADNLVFKDLRELDLGSMMPKERILQLVSRERNPSLEKLSVYYNNDEEPDLADLKKINPRFKRLEVIEEDWGNSDSDSDAEPNEGGSDFSGSDYDFFGHDDYDDYDDEYMDEFFDGADFSDEDGNEHFGFGWGGY